MLLYLVFLRLSCGGEVCGFGCRLSVFAAVCPFLFWGSQVMLPMATLEQP